MRGNSQPNNLIEFSSADSTRSGPAVFDRFWYMAVVAVLAAWTGVSYYMFTSMGWLGRGLVVSMVAVAALLAVMFVRAGSRWSAAHETAVAAVETVNSRRAA